jgi:hypothetical protein
VAGEDPCGWPVATTVFKSLGLLGLVCPGVAELPVSRKSWPEVRSGQSLRMRANGFESKILSGNWSYLESQAGYGVRLLCLAHANPPIAGV